MKIIPYGRQFIDQSDIRQVSKSLKSDLITTGKYVQKFENVVGKKINSKFVLSCSSGTAALHLSFLAINLKKNDVVVMPSINFIASYNLCKSLGAKIFLADVDKFTGQMTPKTLIECIKKNKIKKIKLLITMYLGGYPENVKEFYLIKKKFNCLLIEDACHAFGAKYKLKNKFFNIGSCKHSDLCVFSLHPVKTITSGEGGILTTNNKKLYQRALSLRSHGIIRNKNFHWKYNVVLNGFNYRLSDINCALALSQFKKIKKFITFRKKIFNLYKKEFKDLKFIKIPRYSLNNYPSYHLFVAIFNFKNFTKDKFLIYLKRKKIIAQFHYIPIYKFLIYDKKLKLPSAEKYFKYAVSLPIYYPIELKRVKKIVKLIKYFFKNQK